MHAHDPIFVHLAKETGFLPIVRTHVLVIGHAGLQMETLPQSGAIQAAIEIHPLAAMITPWLPTEIFPDSSGDDRLLQRVKVFAGHFRSLKTERLAFERSATMELRGNSSAIAEASAGECPVCTRAEYH